MIFLVVLFIGCVLYFYRFQNKSIPKYSGPVEKIKISAAKDIVTSLINIAQNNGYFKEYGLDAEVKEYDSGVAAINDLAAGKIDIASAADFAFVKKSFVNKNLRIMGSIDQVRHNIHVVARRDSGISKPSDLKTKTIGLVSNSSSEFFLSTFLIAKGISYSDVKTVNLHPADMENSLATDKVDAVVIWEPFASNIAKHFGNKAITFDLQGSQKYYFLLISNDSLLKKNPQIAERFLMALSKAEDFVDKNPKEAQKLIAKRDHIKESALATLWQTNEFGLSLDQSTLLLMEDEARWFIENKRTDTTQHPDYLDLIYFKALEKVKPESITIIH